MPYTPTSFSPDDSEAGLSLRYTRFWKSLAWGMLLTVAVLTLMPTPFWVPVPFLSWDKAQHCLAYAALMWAFLQAWEGSAVPRWGILLLAVGVGLEILQGMMGVRFMEYTDMLANSLGVLLGYAAWRTPLGRGFRRIETSFSRH